MEDGGVSGGLFMMAFKVLREHICLAVKAQDIEEKKRLQEEVEAKGFLILEPRKKQRRLVPVYVIDE